MPRKPIGMTREHWLRSRLLDHEGPRQSVSVRIAKPLMVEARQYCEEWKIGLGYLFETSLRNHLKIQESSPNRASLVDYAIRLHGEIARAQADCGPLYKTLSDTYKSLGGLSDGSNCDDILPKIYRFLRSRPIPGARVRMPAFERCAKLKAEYQTILNRLEDGTRS